MRQVEPKLEVSSFADFPVLNPSSQGEIGCMPARPSPAQAETANVVAYLKDQVFILCSSISSLPFSRHDIAGFSLACVGVGGNKDQTAAFSLAHVGFGGSKEYVARSAEHVGSTTHDFVRSAGQDFVRSEEQHVVGVGGLQSSVGRGAGTGVRERKRRE